MSLLIFLVIGGLAGWLAGQFRLGYGFGLLGNVLVGVAGAFVGNWVFAQVGITTFGILGTLISATVGAVLLLALLSLIRRA
ncbi:MAG: GlsB/YeaQ/YmgE family stress response membrane protein [Synechococcaceae cyanobacterium SM2_3_2]|nr:GlsB/YeaQ/YmgE family stress response membrane protein [Synechococcaceae cyanobacterium SM2_3_2]